MMNIFPSMPGTHLFALLFPAFFIFYNPERLYGAGDEPETVKIGFLIPMPPETDPLSREAWYGAMLAIEEAGEAANHNGMNFEMIMRSTDGPWGMGSKMAVSLVYEDDVCAIVTSLDGRNAHLAEQVITKAQVALIVTRATDPTITQAYVPWVFRVIYNDEQQAGALATEIYRTGKPQQVLLLTEDNYDSRSGAAEFMKIARERHLPVPQKILFNKDHEIQQIVTGVHNTQPDAAVVFSLPETAGKLTVRLQEKYPSLQLFGPVSLFYTSGLSLKHHNAGTGLRVITPGFLLTGKGAAFRTAFQNRYGFMPGALGANAYEGMKLIIRAVMETGPDREAIRQYLIQLKDYPGVNGTINFDDNGNLRDDPHLKDAAY